MKLFLLVIAFLSLNVAKGQTPQLQREADSLKRALLLMPHDTNRVNTINKLFVNLLKYAPEAAIEYGANAVELSTKLRYFHGLIVAATRMGNYYSNVSNFEKAIEYYQKCKDAGSWTPHNDGVVTGLNGMGLVYEKKGDYAKAAECFNQGLIAAEQANDSFQIAAIYLNLGMLNFDMKDYPQSRQYYQKSVDISRKARAYGAVGMGMACLGNVYIVENKLDSAHFYYLEAIAKADSLGDKSALASRLVNLGKIYELQKKYPEAEAAILKAIQIKEETGDRHGLAVAYKNLGQVFGRIQQYDKAQKYIMEALRISGEIGAAKTYMMSHKAMSELYKKKGDYENAYRYLTLADSLNEILFKEEKIKQIKEAEARYEASHKEQQIAMLSEGKVKDAQLLWQKNLLIGGLVSLVVLLSIIGFLVWRQQHLHAKRNALELEHRLLRAQMNPHFIFNAMQSIQRYISDNDLARANEYMADLGILIRKILEYTGKKSISLQEELDILQLYVNLEQGRLNGMFDYAVEVDEEVDTFETQVPPLVLQPFIENAIWHGIAPKKAGGQLSIGITQTDHELLCEIKDNGIGLTEAALRKSKSPQANRTSHGTAIARERLGGGNAVLMQERLDENGAVEGTTVLLKIPIDNSE